MKKFLTKKSSIDSDMKYCKKCDCELMSHNSSSYCANCKKEKGVFVRNKALQALGIVVAFIVGSKFKNGGSGES